MKEYKGFKVGDIVEITTTIPCDRVVGKITKFGDGKLGGCLEPDTLQVWTNDTSCWDLLYLVSHDMIKKLNKYSIGDKVRRKAKAGVVCTITKVFPLCVYTVDDCGDLKFNECDLEPFDGFRIGDEVWTLKRGKGKIVDEIIFPMSTSRLFIVRFDGEQKDRYPKPSNILTEAEYKEAKNLQTERIYGSTAAQVDENNKRYRCSKFGVGDTVLYCCQTAEIAQIQYKYGKFTYNLNSNNFSDNIPEESLILWIQPSAKFKVGDAVSYCGKKCIVQECYTSSHFDYHIIMNDCPFTARNVKESEIREWKETKFKYSVPMLNGIPNIASCIRQIRDRERFTHLGSKDGLDVFCANIGTNDAKIYYGTKGDDI